MRSVLALDDPDDTCPPPPVRPLRCFRRLPRHLPAGARRRRHRTDPV